MAIAPAGQSAQEIARRDPGRVTASQEWRRIEDSYFGWQR
jgi:hypothetical protein